MNEALVQQVWEKGKPIPGHDENEWRRDFLGLALQRSMYGKQEKYGWGVLYCGPARKTKRDDPADLEPCNWSLVADDAAEQADKARRRAARRVAA